MTDVDGPKVQASTLFTLSNAQKRTRASSSKVRTGCLTCKIRHLKCDESKPACERCTKTGRKCDGYFSPLPRKRGVITPLMNRTLHSLTGSSSELSALTYFYRNTALKLASKYDSDFWNRLIYQMSDNEDSIKYAMIAVGALDARCNLQTQLQTNRTQVPKTRKLLQLTDDDYGSFNETFAVSAYNKAVAAVAERIHSPDAPVQVILLACILFIYVELIRGNVESSLKHVRGGTSIANSVVTENRKTGRIHIETMRQELHPIFNRLELFSMLFGSKPYCEYSHKIMRALPEKFETLKDARNTVVQMMSTTYEYLQTVKLRKYDGFLLPDDQMRKATIQSQNNAWKAAFDRHVQSRSMTESECNMARAIEINYLNCIIWLEIGTARDETHSDCLVSQFEETISLAEKMYGFADASSNPNPIFDMEVISPLYLSATKCRHRLVRRRAISVLRSTTRREGPWDSHMAAAIAERIMNLEERDLINLDGNELPAEHRRIHTMHVQSLSRTQFLVTFYSKPKGLDGPWGIWQEVVVLGGDLDRESPKLTYFETEKPLDQLLNEAGIQQYGFDGHILISNGVSK